MWDAHTISRKKGNWMGKFTVIRKEGGSSRVITITQFIPADWTAAEIEKIGESKNSVTLKIDKVK